MPRLDADDRTQAEPVLEGAFEMANLRPAMTGLPFVVFVSQQGGARHGPRVTISPLPRYHPSEATTITLEQRPLGSVAAPDLARLRQWIEFNRPVLEAYWDGRIAFTEDMLAQIKAV